MSDAIQDAMNAWARRVFPASARTPVAHDAPTTPHAVRGIDRSETADTPSDAPAGEPAESE